jgi:hypothetical protein
MQRRKDLGNDRRFGSQEPLELTLDVRGVHAESLVVSGRYLKRPS